METKLYYDNLYYALVMATDFGVKFQLKETDGKSFIDADIPNNNEDYCEFSMNSGYANEGAGLYVHPDSLRIFEPQEGDLVQDTLNCTGTLINALIKDYYVVRCSGESLKFHKPTTKILMRKNKPFIMPKQESGDANR